MQIEYTVLRWEINNFALAKAVSIYLMVITIPVTFYFYTAITGKSIFLIDIASFIFAVIVVQVTSFKLLRVSKTL